MVGEGPRAAIGLGARTLSAARPAMHATTPPTSLSQPSTTPTSASKTKAEPPTARGVPSRDAAEGIPAAGFARITLSATLGHADLDGRRHTGECL